MWIFRSLIGKHNFYWFTQIMCTSISVSVIFSHETRNNYNDGDPSNLNHFCPPHNELKNWDNRQNLYVPYCLFFWTKTLKQTTLLEAIVIVFVNISKLRLFLMKIPSNAVDRKNVGVSVICSGFFSYKEACKIENCKSKSKITFSQLENGQQFVSIS